jgi:hypothetical protein
MLINRKLGVYANLREKIKKYSVSLKTGVVIKIGFGQQPVKV